MHGRLAAVVVALVALTVAAPASAADTTPTFSLGNSFLDKNHNGTKDGTGENLPVVLVESTVRVWDTSGADAVLDRVVIGKSTTLDVQVSGDVAIKTSVNLASKKGRYHLVKAGGEVRVDSGAIFTVKGDSARVEGGSKIDIGGRAAISTSSARGLTFEADHVEVGAGTSFKVSGTRNEAWLVARVGTVHADGITVNGGNGSFFRILSNTDLTLTSFTAKIGSLYLEALSDEGPDMTVTLKQSTVTQTYKNGNLVFGGRSKDITASTVVLDGTIVTTKVDNPVFVGNATCINGAQHIPARNAPNRCIAPPR